MKKKIIMTLLISTLAFSTLTGCGSKLTKSKITIELGDEDALKVSDFLDLSKDELKKAKLDTKDVDFFKVGDYTATITYDKKDYTIKVKVKDTTAPEIKVSDNIVVQTNTPLHMSDIITEVTELSGSIDASFKDIPKSDDTNTTDNTESVDNTEDNTESTATGVIAVGGCNLEHNDEITYTTAGDYDNTITVSDDNGNSTDIDIKISVIDAPAINGISDKAITVGDTIDYLNGVSATDGKGNDITSKIEVDSSTVDTNTAGTYTATYKVTDDNGFSTGVNCNITVNEKQEEVADNNTSDDNNSNDNTSSNGKKNKKNTTSNNNSGNNSNSSNSGSGSNSASNSSNDSGSSEPNDGLKTFTNPFGDTIRTNPNNWKYDTKYAAEFYPKGFWANGECTTLSEMSDATEGRNIDAARYMLAAGSSQMTQETFDQEYLSDEEFYAKYGWHLSKYQQ